MPKVSDVSDVESTSEYSKDGTEFSEQELELETRQMKIVALDEALVRRSGEATAGTSEEHIRPVIMERGR